MPTNLITVLMPVYNCEQYLDESIESMVSQTFGEFEFIIINDFSIDKSKEIIQSYKDKRIRYFENKENRGVANTLNHGLRLSTGKYIIRMDADDIALPQRIEKQLLFMENNPSIGISGTYYKTFGLYEKEYMPPLSHNEIKTSLLKFNPIGHPTAIFRKDFFNKYNLEYDDKYKYCEDYELWTRAIKYFEIANIPDMLLFHRRHEEQSSFKYRKEQRMNSLIIKKRLFA